MAEFAAEIKSLGDQIAGLKVSQAVELASYLEEVHKIKPAAGGAVMAMPAAAAAPVVVEAKTEFTVSLDGYEAANKIKVIKVVRDITSLGLAEAKALVEGSPKAVKENVSKDEAEKFKKMLEEVGGKVSLK